MKNKAKVLKIVKIVLIVLFFVALVSALTTVIVGLTQPSIGAESIELSESEVIF